MLSLACRHGEIVAELREAGGVLLLMNSRWMLRGYGTWGMAHSRQRRYIVLRAWRIYGAMF